VLNRLWTFHSTSNEIAKEYSLFLAVSIIGLLINTAVVYILSEKRHYNFYISKIVATVVVTCWNFLANYYFTF
jgi:dolichol-phosphate mannosyltransferase